MCGSFIVEVRERNTEVGDLYFSLSLKRNITIICGDTATGKTHLVDNLITALQDDKAVEVIVKNEHGKRVNIPVVTLPASLTETDMLALINGSTSRIIIFDEDVSFTTSYSFNTLLSKGMNNYFVIISRDSRALTYSCAVSEVYKLWRIDRSITLKPVYWLESYVTHREHPLSRASITSNEVLLVEDSSLGYKVWYDLLQERHIKVDTAKGRDRLPKKMRAYQDCALLVLADQAQLGPVLSRILNECEQNARTILSLPESFEWLLLHLDLFKKDQRVQAVLTKPWNYAESTKYFSWERLFTMELIEALKRNYGLIYTKSVEDIAVYNLLMQNKDDLLNVLLRNSGLKV